MNQLLTEVPSKGITVLQTPGQKLTRDEMKNLFRENNCPDGSDGIGPCIPPPYYPPCPDGFYCVAGSNGTLECCLDE